MDNLLSLRKLSFANNVKEVAETLAERALDDNCNPFAPACADDDSNGYYIAFAEDENLNIVLEVAMWTNENGEDVEEFDAEEKSLLCEALRKAMAIKRDEYQSFLANCEMEDDMRRNPNAYLPDGHIFLNYYWPRAN